jgi:hypothetical protein
MIHVAKKLALCLDLDDFSMAHEFIDENCVYKTETKVFHGPEEILNSYKENSESARKNFDELYYRSSVKEIDTHKFELTYFDDLIKKDQKHTYVCKQIVIVNENGKIEMIEHTEVLGQLDLLNLYYEAIGLKKNS